MKAENQFLFHIKKHFLMNSGKTITIEMRLAKLSNIQRKEFPEGYKFNWIAFNREEPEEKVLFDNHHGKEPHYHLNGQEEYFLWPGLEKTLELFYQKIIEKFSHFNKEINHEKK